MSAEHEAPILPTVDVLIVGAGPTGLSAACEAARHGLTVRIVDRTAHRSTYSKALVVHARTLEVFQVMGVADAITGAGAPFAAMRVIPTDGAEPVRVDLMELDWGDTRYPYWLSIPQYETERCLEEHLLSLGVAVGWSTPLVSLLDHGHTVEAQLTLTDGSAETVHTRWVVGCDGGRSLVREQCALGFEPQSIGETFVIADALGDTPMPENEGTTTLSTHGVVFLVPMPEPKRWRIIAHMPDLAEGEQLVLDAPFVDALIKDRLGLDFGAHDLSWTSQFELTQGVALSYRKGRVFIAGDAAHLHSPVGGQGLNTGVQDAHALLWGAARAERGAPQHELLLDSYEAERKAVATSMVKGTTRATSLVTLHSGLLAKLHGFVARHALKANRVQQKLCRAVGMLKLAYEDSPIVVPHPLGAPGQRLPNPGDAQSCLYDLLHPTRHTVLLLGPGARLAAARLRNAGLFCLFMDRGSNDPAPGDGRPDAEAEGGFIDAAGALYEALGDARLVVVRPDRVIALIAADHEVEPIVHYATATLGVSIDAL